MKNLSQFKGWWLLCCIILCIASNSAHAINYLKFSKQQQTTISGTVTVDGMRMTGVTITVLGKQTTTVSGANGQYTIAAMATDTLIFSYVGFTTVSEPVNGRSQINIGLKEDPTALQEVTVNAGYYNVKERERTGSIAKITAKEIEKQPVTNILATMQGRMAGVNITQETGIAGGGFAINIRGVNSLRTNGNAPLYIIDGVPYATDPISHNLTSLAIPGDGNPLSSINPSDIESLEILKDADATAIYGSRGANGVVLITTKRGKAGKTTFTIATSHGVGKVTRMMKLMDTQQYLTMRRQAFQNDGVTPEFYDYDVYGTWSDSRYTDWQKELIGGTSEIDSWQASAAGGNEQTRFLLSGNARSETTVFPGDSKYKRGGARLSLDHTSENKKFNIAFSGGYTAQRNKLPGNDFTTLSRMLPPNAPALHDGNGNLNWENSTWENPLAQLAAESISETQDFVANTVLTYKITNGLDLKSNFGYTDLNNDESRTNPSTVNDPAYMVGPEYSSIYLNTFSRHSWMVEPQLNYKHAFHNSKLDILAGATFQNQQSNRLMNVAYGFSSNSLIHDLASAGAVQTRNNEEILYKYQAFFGRINYNYSDRYIINATGRRDGSSRFGPGKQFATFGAVGAAWLFSKEKLLTDSKILSFGKLRASFGTTGNDQIGDYQFLDTYISSGYDYQGVSGLKPSRLYNADFGWESNEKLEVAIETGFFKDRLFATAAWYRNKSSNQLVGLPLAGTTGFTTIQANLDATVENTGLEVTLRGINLQTPSFSWTTNFNISFPKSELLAFPDLESSEYRNTYVIGQPVTIRKLFKYTGINPETGVYEFEDANNDGAISPSEDRTAIVDLGPKYYGGLQNQFSYKGITLDCLFQFVKQLNFNYVASQGYTGTMRNQPADFTNSWTEPGSNATYQLYTTGYNQAALQAGEYYAQSDAAISDASYIRLKNVALSYDIPERLLSSVRCRFTVQGQNLLTITSYKGADPEFKSIGYLPPLRVISAGLQFTF